MTDTDSIIDLLRSFAIRHYPQRVCDFHDALTVFDGDHIVSLAQALADQDDEVRLLAVEVLYSIGQKAEPALHALIDTLNDPDRIVRVAAVAPVVNFGHKAIEAVPILETWLDCGDEFSDVTAAAAIMKIDPSRAGDVLTLRMMATCCSSDGSSVFLALATPSSSTNSACPRSDISFPLKMGLCLARCLGGVLRGPGEPMATMSASLS